jgi:CHAD domain-containing protein
VDHSAAHSVLEAHADAQRVAAPELQMSTSTIAPVTTPPSAIASVAALPSSAAPPDAPAPVDQPVDQPEAPALVDPPEVSDPPAPPATRPSHPMIAFAYACLRHEFEALRAHRPSDDELPAPDAIHQMRIATRRLRIALRMFRHMLPAKSAKRFSKDLRWFARALGEVRDLDVYADNFQAYLQSMPPEQLQELDGYELHLRRSRAKARHSLGALFEGERYRELLASFAAFLEDAPSPAALRRWRSFRVRDGFKEYLRKSAKRVRKLGRKLGDDAAAKKLHELRIRAKRLRYELEFFTAVYPPLDKLAKATKSLQDLLGEHQDACTATARLEEYAQALPARDSKVSASALEQLLASQRQKADEARSSFAAEWRKFEKVIGRTKLAA